MKNLSVRSSENVLFALLLVAVVGWSAVSVAAREAAPEDAAACRMPGHTARHVG
jgi:hypothetical protein